MHHLQWWKGKKIGIEFNLHFCLDAELIWQSTRNEMRCVEMRLTLLWKNLVAWNWFNSCITRISRFLLYSVWKPLDKEKVKTSWTSSLVLNLLFNVLDNFHEVSNAFYRDIIIIKCRIACYTHWNILSSSLKKSFKNLSLFSVIVRWLKYLLAQWLILPNSEKKSYQFWRFFAIS